MMNRLRTFCARHASVQWAVFGVIMLVVGLAATFPDDALQARLLAEVEQVSGLDVSVTQWAWRWPFRLEWRNVRFEPAGAGVIELPLVRVRPQIWRALTGRAGVDVAADLPAATPDGGGQVAASLSRGFWWSRNLTVLSGSVERVNLAGLGIGSPARGILHATFEQRWPSFPQPDNPDGGEGEWQFEVRDLVLPSVSFGTATLPPLTFSSVTLRLACRGHACRILEATGHGPDGRFEGSGQLFLQPSVADSRLSLILALTPSNRIAQQVRALGVPVLEDGRPMTVTLSGPITQLQLGA